MKVAYVITRSDAIGGAHVHVLCHARQLLARGHAVTVLVGGEGPFTKELAAQGIPYRSLTHLVRSIDPRNDLKAVMELRQELCRLQPDLVSTHSSKAGWLGRLAAKSLRLPVVFTVHGWAFTDGVPEKERRLYVLAERLAAPFTDCFITVSDYDRSLALRYGVGSPDKLLTVHNGVPDVAASLRARPERQPPRLVMVARFEPQKDHATLLEAMARLKELVWELELIGDGPLLDATQAKASRLGLEERVHFLGVRKDVAERLADAQVFALISNWEGLPLTILEAMRAGLPVVASDVGGVSEAVADGTTGFLVPRRSVAILADRLRRLINNPALRCRLGAQGRDLYERGFTANRMFEQTFAIYEGVLNRTRARDRHS